MNIETAKKHYYMYLNDKLNQLGAFKNVFEAVHVSNVVAKKFLLGAEARDRAAFVEAFGEANKLIDANISRMSTIAVHAARRAHRDRGAHRSDRCGGAEGAQEEDQDRRGRGVERRGR